MVEVPDQKGSPIRAIRPQKKRCPPGKFYFQFTELKNFILRAALEPAFSFLSIPSRCAPVRTVDPFSHPSGSSAWRAGVPIQFSNRKERTGLLSPWLPPARFFLVNCSITTRVRFGKRVRSPTLRPSPDSRGTRKLSVPGRVHSVPERFGCRGDRSSNPLLTRDTVESPAKSCFQPLF
jgi:hypothetical protein